MDVYEMLLRKADNIEQHIMYSKVAGITFDNRQYLARRCYVGMRLSMRRDRYNRYDPNAVEICMDEGLSVLGYIPKETARTIAELIDSGNRLGCYVENINESGTGIIGINIKITKIN